jgi:hypothetical protein
MDIEPVPPIVVNNHIDGVIVFLTAGAVNYLESWYLTDEEFEAYDAEGRAVELRLDARGGVVARAVETEPIHARELRDVLVKALEQRGSASSEIEVRELDDLIELATERLDVWPRKSNGLLARLFRRIR